MKALVTGGNGFLGMHLVEQLRARGDDVRVVCRHSHERFHELGVEWCQGDIRDFALMTEACREIETLYHTAAIPGVWGAWKDFYSINTLGTEVVLAACRKAGVTRLVYTSSPSVVYDGQDHQGADESLPYPDSYLCDYPHTKALAERSVLRANGCDGLATVALRPHLIWGPGDNHLIPRLIQRAKTGRLRRVGDGSNQVSIVYVENAAAAHWQAADALNLNAPLAGKAYFINEPEPVRLWDWIDELLGLARLPPVTKSLSRQAAWRLGAALEAIYRLFHLPGEPPMTRFVAAQLSGDHWYSITRARRDFGYTPILSVQDGLRRLESTFKQLGR